MLLAIGVSVGIGLLGHKSPWLIVILWAVLGIGIVIRRTRISTVEILFFFFPLLHPAFTAGTGLAAYPNWFALAWVSVAATIFYTRGCSIAWKKDWIRTPFVYFYIPMVIILLLSLFTNPMHQRALSYMLQTLPVLIVYWMIAQLLDDENLYRVFIAFILGSVVSSLVFIYAFMGGIPSLTFQGFAFGYMRPVIWGIKANTWPYPSMLGMVSLAAITLHRKHNLWEWLGIVTASLILLFTITINMSRSVLLGTFVGGLFVLVSHPRTRRILLVGGIFAGIIFILIFPLIWPYLENVLRLSSGLTGREALWTTTWSFISEDPIFGLGPANFEPYFILRAPFMTNGAFIRLQELSTHNALLQIAVEVGLIGAVLVLCLYGIFIIRSMLLWKHTKGTPYFPSLIALMAMFFAALARSQFEADFAPRHGNLYLNMLIVILFAFQDNLSALVHRKP